ncbi:CoA transferase [Oceanicola sp. S124]|uniref:CoA transferase n=1 Tax=Oceanicola sp. S124 TaxID=1042378 RepID=UPI0002558CA0|nr:CoA transferase [Oceanicola sp. S124]
MSLLSHIKVVELSDGLTDMGGRMLAEMGAEVAVVLPGDIRTDRARAYHHGKTVITGEPEDLRTLIAGADVLLDGRRRAQGDPEDYIALNPGLVHVVAWASMPGTPSCGAPTTDLTLMAQSGLMTIIGDPDRPPLKLPGEQAYALTGIQAATSAMLGLRARRQTGRGQRIDLSARQAATQANYREAISYEWTGRIGHRPGNQLIRGKSGVTLVYPCADGHVTWSMVDNPGMMRAIVAVMVEEGVAGELAEIDWANILVADTDQQVIRRWEGIVAAFFLSHTKAELEAWSVERGWGLSPIFDPAEVRDSAQLKARGLFVDVETPEGTRRYPGPLFTTSLPEDPPARWASDAIPARDFAWSRT